MAEPKLQKDIRYSSQHAFFCKSSAPKCPALPFRCVARKKNNPLVSQSLGATAVTLLGDGELDALALGEGDPGLLATNDKDVGLAGGEGVVNGVLEVDDGEATIVALAVGDDTDTAHVAAAGDHGDGTGIELDEVGDLACLDLNLDGVVDLDEGVGVADAADTLVSKGDGEWTYQPSRFLLRPQIAVPPKHKWDSQNGWGDPGDSTKAWSNG